MEIIQVNSAIKGHFKALENNARAGLLTYSWENPEKLVILHTEINPAFSGQGLGRELVMAAVSYARAQHVKILPLCPYAHKLFQQDETLHDVLFKEQLSVGTA